MPVSRTAYEPDPSLRPCGGGTSLSEQCFISESWLESPFGMAKHPARSAVRYIGMRRSARLAELSAEAVREGREDRAIRYVSLARAVCGKSQTPMPEGFAYCRECLLPLLPGVNCTVRLTGGKVVSACPRCGTVRRMPYIREQKEARFERTGRHQNDGEGSEEGANQAQR